MLLEVAIIALCAINIVNGQKKFNKYLQGTYEFEIAGRPHKLYLCDSSNKKGIKSLHWAIADITNNEYTIAVGRDSNGVRWNGRDAYIATCKIYKLFGDDYLIGEYELNWNDKSNKFTLKERFVDDGKWNSYLLSRISPSIVGNPTISGYQCFEPDLDFDLNRDLSESGTSLWKSKFFRKDRCYRSQLFTKNEYKANCWKITTRNGNIKQSGFIYGSDYDLKWDNNLMINKFDNSAKIPDCKIGTQFLIFVNSKTALLSYQCQDKVTGFQYLIYKSKNVQDEKLKCPFKLPRK